MKKVKRVSAFVLVGILVLTLFGCQAGPTSTSKVPEVSSTTSSAAATTTPAPVEPIKIGGIFPLTGRSADNGLLNVHGAELAVKQINDAGGIKSMGGAKLELVIADHMSDTNQCKATAERLLSDPKIVACIGAAGSGYVMPVLPVFEKQQVPFVTAQLADAITSQGYKFVFQTVAKASDWGVVQIEFLKWLKTKYSIEIGKIGVISEDTEWGRSNAVGCVTAAEREGFDVAYNETFPSGSPDKSALISGLMLNGAEIVIPNCFTQDAKSIVNTMISMKYDPFILAGGAGFIYPAFLAEFNEGILGLTSSAAGNWDSKKIPASIAKLYFDTYGEFITEHAFGSYGNILVIAQALEEAGSADSTALQKALRDLNFETVFPGGPVNFDDTGLNTNARPVIVQWQKMDDGTIVPRTVYPESDAVVEYILPPQLSN